MVFIDKVFLRENFPIWGQKNFQFGVKNWKIPTEIQMCLFNRGICSNLFHLRIIHQLMR